MRVRKNAYLARFWNIESEVPLPEAFVTIEAIELTGDEAGRLLGISPRHVRGLATNGTIKRTARGRYPLIDLVQGFLAAREADARRRAGGDSAGELGRLRAADLQARVDGRTGRLIDEARREAEALIDDAVGRLRAALSAVPARCTGSLPLRAAIEAEITLAIGGVADDFAS